MSGSTAGATGRVRRAGRTSRRRMGGCGRSASPRWRTRSSSVPSSRYSTRSTRRTSWASRTVFDQWVQWWRRKYARGDVIIVRFADDFTAGFEHLGDAKQFMRDLRERFAKFSLQLHPEKTRLIEFGRYAAVRRAARGLGKPETFDFLGFTHICGKTR